MLDRCRRRLVRAFWLARYWLLWKHRRAALVLAVMSMPAIAAFAVAHALFAPPAAPGAPVQAFVDWVVYAVLLVVSAVLSYALAPRPQAPEARQAERPHVKDGAGIVRVYGEVWIDDPVVIGWKPMGVDAIRKGGKK